MAIAEPRPWAEPEEREVAGADPLLEPRALLLRKRAVLDRGVDAVLQRLLERVAQLARPDAELLGRVVDDRLTLLLRRERLRRGDPRTGDNGHEDGDSASDEQVVPLHRPQRSSAS